ncbi:G-type lectin S-receptor-like serine/threonine-protein kinase SD1-13 isoform X2 [Phragmites australis]|nr:G-type lectin S-receptor-like serine/threonine-protein kinase SD1-13 isoform X2 [Phragmites australis]
MKLEHPNIVRLIDYCYETQHEHVDYRGQIIFAEKTTRALCLEYLRNGSLERHLSDEGLEWHKRYKIIKGTCEGLKYIHMEVEEPILHLDLKPDNILLDEDMVPKLADFGLSRIFDQGTQIADSCIGTLGYQPPEYIDRKLISKKFDIFSLGVVMLRTVSGCRRYSIYDGISPEKFVDTVLANWRNRLQTTWSGSLLDAYCLQVKVCTEIALECVETERTKRPNIVEIIDKLNAMENQLDELKLDWRGSHTDEEKSPSPPPPPPPPRPVTADAPIQSETRPYKGPAEDTTIEGRRSPEILSVHPLQLWWYPRSMISLHLSNNTDGPVVFRLLSKRPMRDFVGPTCGVVPPSPSRFTLHVRLRKQLSSDESIELVSIKAGGQELLPQGDVRALDFLYQHSSFINKAREAGREVQAVKLTIAETAAAENFRRFFLDCFAPAIQWSCNVLKLKI